MSIKEQIVHNPKIAAGVSAMTTGTGAGTVLDWIPDDIGKLATLVGIILSVILIRVYTVTLKKGQLELSIMKAKELERVAEVEARKKHGMPLRRDED